MCDSRQIVELARHWVRDSTSIAGTAEGPCDDAGLREDLRVNRRKILQRQSSMDFIPNIELNRRDNIKDNLSINRLVEW